VADNQESYALNAQAWSVVDPYGTGFINYHDLELLLKTEEPPLGAGSHIPQRCVLRQHYPRYFGDASSNILIAGHLLQENFQHADANECAAV